MGKQVQFHLLPDDLQAFLQFVQNRDPVIVTPRSSDIPEIKTVADPSSETQVMVLWNQAILSSLTRKHIVYPGRAYYGIDASLPTLELSPSIFSEWNGREALLQGRLYGFFDNPTLEYMRWYNALAQWIRKNSLGCQYHSWEDMSVREPMSGSRKAVYSCHLFALRLLANGFLGWKPRINSARSSRNEILF